MCASKASFRRETTLGLAFLVTGLAAMSGQARAEAALPFTPHQALYDLSLTKARGNASLQSANGRILYNFSGSACEGYASEFRQVSDLDLGEGKSTVSDLRATSWEDGKGHTFRFQIETRMNDDDASLVDGIAERVGDKIKVNLKKPDEKSFTIDGATVFPTQQVHRILDAARAGKTLLELSVYDGSDNGEKIYSTLTVIGQEKTADTTVTPDASLEDSKQKAVRRWPVTVSYFDQGAARGDGEQTPVYSMSFELYENGVSRSLTLDYNSFVIGGTMSKFSAKPATPCKP